MRDIRKPEFMANISSKGHQPILEILIALAVFFVGSMVGSFVQMPALMVYLLGNREYQEMVFSGRMNIEKVMELILNVPQWITIVLLVGELGLILAVFLYCRLLEKRKLSTLGFRRKGCVLSYMKGMLLGVLLFGAAYLVCFASGSLTVGQTDFSGETLLYVGGFFLGYLIQGMAEEALCRGYLLVSLSRRCSMALSVVLSSLFFSMLHGMNHGITLLAYVNLFLFGVFMALLFIRCENIWIVGAVHSVWNFAQGNLFGVQVSGMKAQPSLLQSKMADGWQLINGGAFGMEGGLAVTMVLAAALGILLYSMKRHGYFVEVSPRDALRQNMTTPPINSQWGNGSQAPQNGQWGNGSQLPQNGQWGNGSQAPQNGQWGNGSQAPQNGQWRDGSQATQGEGTKGDPGNGYENMGLNPEETPWHPREEGGMEQDTATGFDQSYFKD